MLATLNALLDQPLLLILILAAGAACGIGVERFVERQKLAQRRAYWAGRKTAKAKSPIKLTKAVDVAAEQMKCVMQARFTARPLLNRQERRLLAVIDAALAEYTPGWRSMGQVSLGEILSSNDKDAFLAVNSKRVDLLIVDAECKPLHAVEFQGTGHHLGQTAAGRDAVKKEALRRAGIGYAEVVSGDTPAEVKALVRKLAGRASVDTGASAIASAGTGA